MELPEANFKFSPELRLTDAELEASSPNVSVLAEPTCESTYDLVATSDSPVGSPTPDNLLPPNEITVESAPVITVPEIWMPSMTTLPVPEGCSEMSALEADVMTLPAIWMFSSVRLLASKTLELLIWNADPVATETFSEKSHELLEFDHRMV